MWRLSGSRQDRSMIAANMSGQRAHRNPGEEALGYRFRLFLSACELGLPRQAIVANLLVNLVQSGDGV